MPREKKLGPGELSPPWTVLKLLRWTTGYFEDQGVTTTPRLDADLLLSHVLDLDRVQLYARTEEEVEEGPRRAFRQLVKRRANGEPVAYLVGRKEFWQMELKTDDRAIVPRPETEVVVEVALELLSASDGEQRAVDIGTGTGAIALALAQERQDMAIAATDVFADTVELAVENADAQGLGDRIEFFEGDLFEPLPDEWVPLDLVTCNPPYVPEPDREDVTIEVRDHERDEALFAGPEGLDLIRPLVSGAHERLKPGGWLVFEHGHQMRGDVQELLEEAGYVDIQTRQDYEESDRVSAGKKADD